MNFFLLLNITFFSLLIGSFFTVVIYRVPLILHQQWRQDSLHFLTNEELAFPNKDFNIFFPFSHCPNCQKYLTFFQKLPLLSYFFLKGKCAYCEKKISFCYPLIEILTLVTSLVVIERFGMSLQMIAALILTWGLLILAFIDFQHGILPDIIVFPLLWCGLISSIYRLFISPEAAILGASFAYIFLYIFAKAYQFLIQAEAMGEGDFKCFALLGAWLGIGSLPYILFMAAFLGSIIGIIFCLGKKDNLRNGIAFGPYLAISGWLVLLNCGSSDLIVHSA